MTSVSNGQLAVTSWAWVDDDGNKASREAATFRLWRVRAGEELVGLLALPKDVDEFGALRVAVEGFSHD